MAQDSRQLVPLSHLSVAKIIIPIIAGIFTAFLVTGIAIPVLPLHVHLDLKLGSLMVGIVAGTQFAASLLCRYWSGNFADNYGGKRSMTRGLIIAVVAGILYLISLQFVINPMLSVMILIAGRAVLGVAESFIVSGALVWGLSRAGTQNTGKVMAWVGTAMFVAFAIGAPLGTYLFQNYGFVSIAIGTLLLPVLNILYIYKKAGIKPVVKGKPSLLQVLKNVWLPGVGMAFSSVGFGAITTFIVLLYEQHHWEQAWMALSAVSVTFVTSRVIFGYLPDKIGGARSAAIFILLEVIGQILIWFSNIPTVALLGAALTGLGYALVYPGFGVEAVRGVPLEIRGVMTGAYTAFLDLALALSNPLLGLIAGHINLRSVFMVSAIAVSFAFFIALRLLTLNPRP